MSECHYWWRSGDVQWCDRKSDGCTCGGWEEGCDMKKTGRSHLELDLQLVEEMETLHTRKKTKLRDDRAA